MIQKLSIGTAGFALVFASIFAFAPQVSAETDLIDDSSPAVLQTAKAKNTGGTNAKEAGDSVILEFSETTNKYEITKDNIATELQLNNSHSFLDGAGALGQAEWSDNGKKLFIILSGETSLPTVASGDKVSMLGQGIKDLSGNAVTGNAIIAGSFTSEYSDGCPRDLLQKSESGSSEEGQDKSNKRLEKKEKDKDDDCDRAEEERAKFRCGNGLQNGKLYKLAGSDTVYLMAACTLRPFRGRAAFDSRGHKFQDIQVLTSLPPKVTISDKPVVPAEGTLVKGSNATVWFVDHNGKRRGFISANIFASLGFSFEQVDQISDSDLGEIEEDSNVESEATHPDGALLKCGDSAKVFKVIGKVKFPFANADSFTKRGHRFTHILVIDCGRFGYRDGAPITE